MKIAKKLLSLSITLCFVLSVVAVPNAISSSAQEEYTLSSKVSSLMNNYFNEYSKIEDEIDSNIEKYRKSDGKITVIDEKGNPVKNAQVTVNQTSHNFDFGVNALMLGQYDSVEKNAKYEKLITDVFNLVTTTSCFDIYSNNDNDYDFDYGEFRRPAPNYVRDFAKANNLKFKMQPLLTDGWNPDWATTKDVSNLRDIYKRWFQAIYDNFGDDLDIVDVVNESTSLWQSRNPNFPFNKNVYINVEWAYQTAQEIFKNSKTKLEINDAYAYFSKYLSSRIQPLNSGNFLDSVASQYHFFSGSEMLNHINGSKASLTETYNNFKTLSNENLPMYISEITMPTNISGYTTEESQQIQAEVIKRLYKMWFSIPNMNGIIYWNMVDGEQWGSEGDALGCIVDSDMNEKYAYNVIKNYVNNEWMTKNLTVYTDENGVATFRGFEGNYDVTISNAAGNAFGSFNLEADGSGVTLMIKDGFDSSNAVSVESEQEYKLSSAATITEYTEYMQPIKSSYVASSFTTSKNCAFVTVSNSAKLSKVSSWTTPEAKPSSGAYLQPSDISSSFFWQMGHYNASGNQAKYYNRVRVRKLIEVSSENKYVFNLNKTDCDYVYTIREFDSNGNFINNVGNVSPGTEYVPSEGTEYIGLSLLISSTSQKTVSLKSTIANSTLVPSVKVISSQSTDTNPNLIKGGAWVKGQYMPDTGAFSSTSANCDYRVAYNKKLKVTPNTEYTFDVGTTLSTVKFVLRGYDSNDKYVAISPATIVSGKITIPENVVKISVTLYDTRMTSGYTAAQFLEFLNNKTINPMITSEGSINLDLSMRKGASIRLGDKTGIRFYTNVNKSQLEQLKQNGYTVELGTIISPKDLLKTNDLTLNFTDIVNVPFTSSEFFVDGDFEGVVGSITNIKETSDYDAISGNINRDYVGRGYAKISKDGVSTVIYADYADGDINNNTRSIAYVAYQFKNDDNKNSKLYNDYKAQVDKWAGWYRSEMTYTKLSGKNQIIVNNALIHNAAEITPYENGGYLLSKLPTSVSANLSDTGKLVNHFSSGMELRFFINSKEASVTLSKPKLTSGDPVQADVLVYKGDSLYKTYTIDASKSTIKFTKDEFKNEMVRVLFYYRSICIHDISGDIRVPTDSEQNENYAVFYGSSITNGYNANSADKTFVYQISKNLNVDAYNLGLSGSCLLEPEIAEYLTTLDNVSFMSIAMGANMHGDTISEFKSKVTNFLKILGSNVTDIPIFCVDQIYNYDDKAGGTNSKTEQMRNAVKQAVNELGYSNLYYVNGLKLMNTASGLNSADGISDDSTHPNQYGVDMVAENFTRIIQNLLNNEIHSKEYSFESTKNVTSSYRIDGSTGALITPSDMTVNAKHGVVTSGVGIDSDYFLDVSDLPKGAVLLSELNNGTCIYINEYDENKNFIKRGSPIVYWANDKFTYTPLTLNENTKYIRIHVMVKDNNNAKTFNNGYKINITAEF